MTIKHDVDQISGLTAEFVKLDAKHATHAERLATGRKALNAVLTAVPNYMTDDMAVLNNVPQTLNNRVDAIDAKITDMGTSYLNDGKVKATADATNASIDKALSADGIGSLDVLFDAKKAAVLGGELDAAHDTLGEMNDYVEGTLDVQTEITDYLNAKKAAFLADLQGASVDGMDSLNDIVNNVNAIDVAAQVAAVTPEGGWTGPDHAIFDFDSYKTIEKIIADGPMNDNAAENGTQWFSADTATNAKVAAAQAADKVTTTSRDMTVVTANGEKIISGPTAGEVYGNGLVAYTVIDGDQVELLLDLSTNADNAGKYVVPNELNDNDIVTVTIIKVGV